MKVRFITALYNYAVTSNLGRGDKINETTFITNDRKVIDSLLPKEAIPIIGQMEAKAISDAKVVIYSDEELPEGVTPEQHLITKLYQVQTFISSLWLFDDHSINDELGYLMNLEGERLFVSSNFLSSMNSMPNGEIGQCVMSRSILKEARAFYRKSVAYPSSPFQKPLTQLTRGNNRVSRALYHVMAARSESDIPMKVSCYCSALETLFSTNQAELSHQLSERVAFFLSDDAEERLRLFRNMKAAYVIRSKMVHGDTIRDSDLPKVIESSAFCDGILRRIVKIILASEENLAIFDSKPADVDEFFLGILFGLRERLPNA